MNVFLKGFVFGFSIAAALGPIGLLCIRKTLAYGRLSGFVSGLGAAMGDAFYGAVAVLGLTVISDFLLIHQKAFQFCGGLFLCYLGINTFLSKPSLSVQETKKGSLLGDFVSTFALTIINPLTILSFIAVFAGLSVVSSSSDYISSMSLILGIFLGSASWWLVLSTTTGFFRKSLTQAGIVIVNKVSGSIIVSFGCWAFWEFLKNVL